MAFCTNCGTKLEDAAKFCPKCGTPVAKDAQTPKAAPAPDLAPKVVPAPDLAAKAADIIAILKRELEKALPVLKRNYKTIAIAALSVVVLLLLFSRCAGGKGGGTGGGNTGENTVIGNTGGDKKEQFLDQIQGYWKQVTLVYGSVADSVNRPYEIGITKNIINLGEQKSGPIDCPVSGAEYKDDALYFSAKWYQGTPVNEQQPGMQNFDLRLTYDESSDLLILAAKVSDQWGNLAEYAREN